MTKSRPISIGERFSELTVIGELPSYKQVGKGGKQSSRKMWLVKCRCGKEFPASGSKLRRGITTICSSCAYKMRPQSAIRYTGAEILFKRVILNRAKKVGISVDLTPDDFVEIATSECHYCGAEPTERKYHGKRDVPIRINGVDRIDSSKGYSKDNCLPCCTICNVMKASLGYDEFLEHVAKILKRRGAK